MKCPNSKSNQSKVLQKYTGEALKDEVSKCLPFQHHIHTDRQNERTTRSGLPNAILMLDKYIKLFTRYISEI
jgi:hypothetical protein